MTNNLQLYARYAGISLRGQMQYRASFILQALGAFFNTGLEFAAVWMLFDRFGQLKSWTLPEMALLYGTIAVTFAIADSIGRGFDQFASTVKAGDFDRLLLRPRSTVLQLLGQELTLRRIGRLAQGAVVLAYAISHIDVHWSIARATLLVMSIICGVCLFLGLLIMQATSAFWTTESLEVWNAFTYGGVFMSQYPVSIYRTWFARFFTFVIPLACINYLPALVILDRETSPMYWLAPLAGVVFLLIALQGWKFGVRHYRSTGS
ncbi:MAG: ABC-2 family transporter protein [Anaerolineae bacterium]|nr:ABC-2 family transporter protein [Phycisphaerae bacterium]